MNSHHYEAELGRHALAAAETILSQREEDIVGPDRFRDLVSARSTIIKALELLGMSVSGMARTMHRDHSTICYHLHADEGDTVDAMAIVEAARDRADLDLYPKRYLIWVCTCGQENVLEAIAATRRSLVCTNCHSVRLKTDADLEMFSRFARDPRPGARAALLLEGATSTLLLLKEDHR